jgi:hypothetical protein
MGKIKVPKKDTLVDVEKIVPIVGMIGPIKPNGKNDSGKIITIDNKSSNLKMGKPAINASVGRIDTAN